MSAEARQVPTPSQYQNLRRLLGELRGMPWRASAVVLLIIIVSVAYASVPWLISRAIDRNVIPGDQSGLAITGLLLAIAFVSRALAESAQMYQVGVIAQRVLASLRMRLFAKFQAMPIAALDRQPSGTLMSRMTSDVDTLDTLLTQAGPHFVAAIFNFIGVIVAMLLMDWKLALATFVVIPPMMAVVIASGDRAHPRFRTTRETAAEISSELQEAITGVRDIQSLNSTEASVERFRAVNERNKDASIRAATSLMLVSPAFDLLSACGTAIVIGVGGYLASAGQTTVGTVAGFIVYVHLFHRPIFMMAAMYERLPAALAGADLIYGVLDTEEDELAGSGISIGRISGDIQFESVEFAYDPERPALRGVSLHIRPGERVAIVGETGAGKSTLINLILGFYDATSGAVTIDGHDVCDLQMSDVRTQMAVVLQEGHIFTGTVAENIEYGLPGASRADVEHAARVVGAHDILANLLHGYDTQVGQQGRLLSQGQRQLVALARAVLVQPRILILDEATSNIDLRTERAILEGTRALMHDCTSIVIAHRFSRIVTDADRILVLDGGKVVEEGSHEELVALGGAYARFYRYQDRLDTPAMLANSMDGES